MCMIHVNCLDFTTAVGNFQVQTHCMHSLTLITWPSGLYVTVSGKTTLLAEIEKVGFLLPMDSINTRLCCGTSS